PTAVMPIWTEERNRPGCSASRKAIRAPRLLASSGFSRPGRAETTASSDIARTPFTTISARMTRTSAIIGNPLATPAQPGDPVFDFASWPSLCDPHALARGKVAEELPRHPARARAARGLPFDRLGLQPVLRHLHPMRGAIAA